MCANPVKASLCVLQKIQSASLLQFESLFGFFCARGFPLLHVHQLPTWPFAYRSKFVVIMIYFHF